MHEYYLTIGIKILDIPELGSYLHNLFLPFLHSCVALEPPPSLTLTIIKLFFSNVIFSVKCVLCMGDMVSPIYRIL